MGFESNMRDVVSGRRADLGPIEAAELLVDTLRSRLEVDGAIIALHHYAGPRRQNGGAQILRSVGSFADPAVTPGNQDQMSRMADPIDSFERGDRFFACVPVAFNDESPMGRVAVYSSHARDFGDDDLEILRGVARSTVALLSRGPLRQV